MKRPDQYDLCQLYHPFRQIPIYRTILLPIIIIHHTTKFVKINKKFCRKLFLFLQNTSIYSTLLLIYCKNCAYAKAYSFIFRQNRFFKHSLYLVHALSRHSGKFNGLYLVEIRNFLRKPRHAFLPLTL